MLVLNLPFKALMFLTLMRPSLVLFLVLWLKLVKDFLKVRCRLALLPFLISCLIWLDLVASLPLIKEDRKSGSAGMPRPTSYAVFCLKKKRLQVAVIDWILDPVVVVELFEDRGHLLLSADGEAVDDNHSKHVLASI